MNIKSLKDCNTVKQDNVLKYSVLLSRIDTGNIFNFSS